MFHFPLFDSAKTRAIRSLARLIDADFHRLQFTPDLRPADLGAAAIIAVRHESQG